MSGANQEMLMTIVSMGLGFDVPDIQQALIATGNSSVEDAIQLLFNQGASGAGGGSSTATSTSGTGSAPSGTTGGSAMSSSGGRTSSSATETAEEIKKRLEREAAEKQREREREEAEREKRVKQEREEWEKTQRERAEKAKLHAQRTKEHRSRLAQRKKAKKTEHRRDVLKWHSKQEAYARKEAAIVSDTVAKRSAQESDLDSPVKCLDTLYQRYGDTIASNSVRLLIRILSKIQENPGNSKYRRIALSASKIKTAIVTPLGALKFLKFVGFEETTQVDPVLSAAKAAGKVSSADEKKDDVEMKDAASIGGGSISTSATTSSGIAVSESSYLILPETVPIDPNVVKALQMLRARVERDPTEIVEILQSLVDENVKRRSEGDRTCPSLEEWLYYGCDTLYERLHNLQVSELKSEHLKYLFVDDPIFKARIGSNKRFLKMIREECGFGELRGKRSDAAGERVLVFSVHSLLKLGDSASSAVVTLEQEKAALLRLKHLTEDLAFVMKQKMRPHLTLFRLQSKQNVTDPSLRASLVKLYQFLLKALDRILDEPLEEKWRRPLSVKKMKERMPGIVGVPAYLRSVGFHKDETASVSGDAKYSITDTSPVNMNLLQMHRDLLDLLLKSL